MDDTRIIELFLSRSEEAISETQKKYGAYCRYIAKNVLGSDEDADECVNDTYLKVWNSVPPARPQNFSAFIGTVARNLALNKLDFKNAKKRSTQTNLALSELEECEKISISVERDKINIAVPTEFVMSVEPKVE